MPQLTLGAQSNGLIVEASVWVSAPRRAAMFRASKDVPPAVRVSLIVDTGADSSMLSDQVMRSLGLTATSQTRIVTFGSKGVPEPCDVYDIDLEIHNLMQQSWRIPTMEILVRPLHNQPRDGMLGRDLLKAAILHYDGSRGSIR